MKETKVYCYPYPSGGFQLEVVCGERTVEIHIDDPCTVFVLTDAEGKDEEMECDEYSPTEEEFPVLAAVTAINRALKWVKEEDDG